MKKSLVNASNLYIALIVLGCVFLLNQPTKVESAKKDVFIPVGIEKQPEQIQGIPTAPVPAAQAPLQKPTAPKPTPTPKPTAPKPTPPAPKPVPAAPTPVPPPAPVIESCDSGAFSQQ